MLVLSRRPGEKILFPNVGISVEIIQTKGNTVRVGIEAPKDVRILRDELAAKTAKTADLEPPIRVSDQSDTSDFGQHQLELIRERIDEILLAIALAQNQQRQGLTDNADVALVQAVERLEVLKNCLDNSNEKTAVCESKTGYQVPGVETKLHSELSLWPQSNRRDFRFEFEFAIAQ